MLRYPAQDALRQLRTESLSADLAIVGGGMAGSCAAITAARAGARVVLIQDRPVLGGNASSEVRLWILGATSHMGNNNRWAREGGVIDEILVENTFRNREGNPLLFDAVVLDKVLAEPNITLLLNTAVFEISKQGRRLESARAFCSQNSTLYEVQAPVFLDASGDGLLGYLAGASFRVGAEPRSEFNEGFAPNEAYGELLGHTIYFYSKDAGRPVSFTPPAFALKDISVIPRHRDIQPGHDGCALWWFEYGGRLDTVHDTEKIKWELWRVAYGAWHHIKNSGLFPQAANLTLEWIGHIPGKREARRFEGDAILTQNDIVHQTHWPDAVSFGGWAMDLHPADGLYSPLDPCTQYHSKGVYQIPYRCLYSKDLDNLFLAGRSISASHVAFGSTRVQATCASAAQAAGLAAAWAAHARVPAREIPVPDLQQALLRAGQFIPGLAAHDPQDLATQATLFASSEYTLSTWPSSGETLPLDVPRALLLPLPAGPLPTFTFTLDVAESTSLTVELRIASKPGNYTPDLLLESQTLPLHPGSAQPLALLFESRLAQPNYAILILAAAPGVHVHLTEERVTGILALSQTRNAKVAKAARQAPPPGSGIDSFDFWFPARRPAGQNLALSIDPPLAAFPPAAVLNGFARPFLQPNAWVAAPLDPLPRLTLRWASPQTIARVELAFDTDFDHPMETVQFGHPESAMPFCVASYRLLDAAGALLHACPENHHTRNTIVLSNPVTTDTLTLEILSTHGLPAALFEVRCYEA